METKEFEFQGMKLNGIFMIIVLLPILGDQPTKMRRMQMTEKKYGTDNY